ncbi:MAG: hypothetical protein WBL02_09485 [Methanomethylovorans sp.]|nr:hypothetical protein [Methanomethylovorans sp.]
MSTIFDGLIERARYYEQFEQFSRSVRITDYQGVDACRTTEV